MRSVLGERHQAVRDRAEEHQRCDEHSNALGLVHAPDANGRADGGALRIGLTFVPGYSVLGCARVSLRSDPMCEAPGHHYGDSRSYAIVRQEGQGEMVVCRYCLSWYADEKDRGKPIEIERL